MLLCVVSRAITCSHLQCFDAALFLQMNERYSVLSVAFTDSFKLQVQWHPEAVLLEKLQGA